MRSERVVRRDRLGDQIRLLRLHPRVDMRAVVAVWPTVKAAVTHRSHVIGHQIAAEFAALIDRHPQRTRHRIPRQAIRSEEHTSELQSLMRISYAVLCLKKKKITI